MELKRQLPGLDSAPKSTVKCLASKSRFHTGRIRVQPCAPTGQPAVRIKHGDLTFVACPGHHPH
jgi:hypothetical protein